MFKLCIPLFVILFVITGCANTDEKINRCLAGADVVEEMARLRDSGLSREDATKKYSMDQGATRLLVLIEYVYGLNTMTPEQIRYYAFNECVRLIK